MAHSMAQWLLIFFGAMTVSALKDYREVLMGPCKRATDCMCDSQCGQRNDCCPAIDLGGPKPSFEPQRRSCITIAHIFTKEEVVQADKPIEAIASCPEDESLSVDVVNACKASSLYEPEMQDVILEEGPFVWLKKHARVLVPVVDVRDRQVYANIDCAICNGVFSSKSPNIPLWEIKKYVLLYPLKVTCTENMSELSCQITGDLPYSLSPLCSFMGPRGIIHYPSLYAFGFDDIFILPEEYLAGGSIKLPFEQLQDNITTTNSTTELTESQKNVGEFMYWLQIVITCLSILGLSVLLLIYWRFSQLRRSLAGRLTMGLAVALLCAQVAFLNVSIIVPLVENRGFCVTMATVFLYCLLSSFMWMALFGGKLLATFTNVKSLLTRACQCGCIKQLLDGSSRSGGTIRFAGGKCESDTQKEFRKHLFTALLVPLCITAAALIANETAYTKLLPFYDNATTSNDSQALDIDEELLLGPVLARLNPGFCPYPDWKRAWFAKLMGLIIWFLAPAASLISFNLLVVIIVCFQLYRMSRSHRIRESPENTHLQKQKKNLFGICIKLSVILGASWFIQFFAGWWPQLEILRRIGGLMNSAQGGIIALCMLLSTKARRVLIQHLPKSCQSLPCFKPSEPSSKSTTTNSSGTWTKMFSAKQRALRTQSSCKTDSQAISP
ncbi:unnamed protein product [Dibothriocephalus latus]|uniref:G-protein coupled receptors family 2 profile 2 domain-containing protein n=1 Tax=Dibothriocephalus latus TaxID=60516 RepID=A0A3P6ULD6_DIBLA|nr:unnamed protein product [Dibothriocephalus latus]